MQRGSTTRQRFFLSALPDGPMSARVGIALAALIRAAAANPLDAMSALPIIVASAFDRPATAELRIAFGVEGEPDEREVYRFTSEGEMERAVAVVVGEVDHGPMH